MLEVEDDGVGIAPERDIACRASGLTRPDAGIGVRNVRERMEVLYGADAAMAMESRPGRGTRVTLEMPSAGLSADGILYADGSAGSVAVR